MQLQSMDRPIYILYEILSIAKVIGSTSPSATKIKVTPSHREIHQRPTSVVMSNLVGKVPPPSPTRMPPGAITLQRNVLVTAQDTGMGRGLESLKTLILRPTVWSLSNMIAMNPFDLIWLKFMYHMPCQITELLFTCAFHNAEISVGIFQRTHDCPHGCCDGFPRQFGALVPCSVVYAFVVLRH